jgi:hypothetical protein
MIKLKKNKQLGIDAGTAASRLRKELLFKYIRKAGDNYCFQCGAEIETTDELSVEHKVPWLDSEDPIEMFFNLENIAFSHLKCNIGARRGKRSSHGILRSYMNGCRCNECKKANSEQQKKYRATKK